MAKCIILFDWFGFEPQTPDDKNRPLKKKDFFTYHNNNYRLFSLYMQLGNDFTIKKKYFNVKHKINIMPVKLVTPASFIQNWANFFSENY